LTNTDLSPIELAEFLEEQAAAIEARAACELECARFTEDVCEARERAIECERQVAMKGRFLARSLTALAATTRAQAALLRRDGDEAVVRDEQHTT
jgi:hypothetical protein